MLKIFTLLSFLLATCAWSTGNVKCPTPDEMSKPGFVHKKEFKHCPGYKETKETKKKATKTTKKPTKKKTTKK